MAGDPRAYEVTSPHMEGGGIENWQKRLNRQMRTWTIDYRLKVDGDFGVATRDLSRTVAYGLGITTSKLDGGVTPDLRVKIRNEDLTEVERRRCDSRRRCDWRERLKRKHAGGGVCSPLVKISAHSNGFSGHHDGVDLICPPNAPGFAMCKAEVVRADKGGWWGLGAPSDPDVRARGDGIVVIRSLVDIGPIEKGMNFCYGHAEKPCVKVGDIVEAGQRICDAGLANAWHFHFMVNCSPNARGVGDRDPWPIIRYAISHA